MKPERAGRAPHLPPRSAFVGFRTRPRTLALVVSVALLVAAPAAGQDPEPAERLTVSVAGPDEMQIVVLEDGSRLIGRILAVRDAEIEFASGELGTLTIEVADLREVRVIPADSVRDGEYWFPNPNRTRLLFAPTGRTLRRGSGYFADHLVFLPGFVYGVTDRITVGGGMSVFPGVSFEDQAAYLSPKIGWNLSERLDVAVGALLTVFPGNRDDDYPKTAGILFSVATWGSPDASITAGVGHGYEGDGLAERPMLMVGGERRVFRRIALVTENWIFPGLEGQIVSYGVRFLGERMSVDLAAVHLLGDGDAFFMPYASFVFLFGER